MSGPWYVPSTVYIGNDGHHRIMRGYTEIGGIRIEDDIIVYDQYGQPVESRGRVVAAYRVGLQEQGGVD